MPDNHLPLLADRDLDAPLLWRRGEPVSARRFLVQAKGLSRKLPQGEYLINLCEDRYNFMLAFVAMLLRGQINLLPANRSSAEVESVSARYGQCPCVVDDQQEELSLPQYRVECGDDSSHEPLDNLPSQDASGLCAVVFTSGSTGESVPWSKSWGELYHGAQENRRILGLEGEAPLTVVATVPPQHMFGLEMTVLLPLVAGLAVDAGRPFFPHDLQQALLAVPEPRLLVTTPVHLNTCLEAGLPWPDVEQIVSATAPLSMELAERAEQAFAAVVNEVYGSTETGAIATRRTAKVEVWTLHEQLQLRAGNGDEGSVTVSGGHLASPVVLNDRVQLEPGRRFRLLGRDSDMLKIAGKRVSLGDLNHKLLAIDGVEDGVFVVPNESDGQVLRLSAVVVAPKLSKSEVLDALKRQLDPLCLPRPLYLVEQLPRNESGKLPHGALMQMLKQLRRG